MTVVVRGLPDLKAAFAELKADLRRRILRNALAAGARVVRNEARRLTPILRAPVRKRGKLIRKPGTVQQAISVRTSKRAKSQGHVGVFVNVRPAKGLTAKKLSRRGADSPDDPYYWRWLEFGRKGRAGVPQRAGLKRGGRAGPNRFARRALRAVGPLAPQRFLQRSAAKLPQALTIIEAQIAKGLAKYQTRQP
jgi:HK97 gp10 family phage protein